MKTYTLIALFGHALLVVHAANQRDINTSCDEAWGVIDCDRTVSYPSFARGVYDSGGKQTGVEVVSEETNICNAIEEALGNWDFVNNADVNCKCLNVASYYGDSSGHRDKFDGQINQGVTDGTLGEIYGAESCLSNNDYIISTNRSSVIKSQLSAANGWTFVRAPDVDVAIYRKLLKAAASCYSGTCDGPKLQAFFSSYVDSADSVISSEFVQILNDWITLFTTLKQKTKDVQTYSKQVQSRLKTVSSKVESIKASVCRNSACKGSTPTNAFKKFYSTITTIRTLQGVPNAAEKSLSNIPKMTKITHTAIEYSTTAADENYYVGLMEDYQITSVRDMIKAFRVTEYLPQAGEDLKKLVNIFNLISNHAGAAKTGATSIKQILATNWAKNSELAKSTSGRKIRDGLINIQKAFRDELKGPLENLIKANTAVDNLLAKFPLRKKRLEFASGGAYYTRWTDIQMEVPCSVAKMKRFYAGEFWVDHNWSEFEACDFGPKKVNFIKHAIPYIKYRFI